MEVRKLSAEERFEANVISTVAFHMRMEDPEKSREESLKETVEDWGAFADDGKMMARIINHRFQVWLDGQTVPCGGIGAVSTLPEYRNTGAVREIFGKLIPAAYQNGEVISALYPFSHAFYRKFGYETVRWRNDYEFAPSALSGYAAPEIAVTSGTLVLDSVAALPQGCKVVTSGTGALMLVDPTGFDADTHMGGTQNLAGTPTLTDAINVCKQFRDKEIVANQQKITDYVLDQLMSDDRISLYGVPRGNIAKIPLFSFSVKGAHHEDLALILDKMGIAVRSGQMCAEPIMDRFGVTGMLRASFAPYNTMEEAEYFIKSLDRAIKMLV